MEITDTTVWERLRPKLVQAGEKTLHVLGDIIAVALALCEVWMNMEATCARCQRTFLNRDMRSMPDLFPDSFHRFCADCRTILLQDQMRASKEQREYRVLLRNLDRAMINGGEATLTLAEWNQTVIDFDGHCWQCRVGPYEDLEHLIPISRGGGTTVGNCLPSCHACNLRKGDRHPDDIVAQAVAIMRARKYLELRQAPLAKPAAPASAPPSLTHPAIGAATSATDRGDRVITP